MVTMSTKRKPFEGGIPNLKHGEMYIHCGMCLNEWKEVEKKYPDGSKDLVKKILQESDEAKTTKRIKELVRIVRNGRYDVAWTEWGLQVWCPEHDVNVIHIDFDGQKHVADTSRQKTTEELK